MKISEIISEGRKGQLDPDHKQSMHSTYTYNDKNGAGFDYNYYRVGMAAAMADGSNRPLDIDDRTWYHHDNVAVPYSKAESDMLKQAFKHVNTSVNHVVRDHRSKESSGTHTISPVSARRPNRYGV